ncbi:MAG: hypothetical protein JWR62_1819 [Modestobacter sp.]|jgi:hypothetical protein|nr:hypothetical protein [Modestobacter sp.]
MTGDRNAAADGEPLTRGPAVHRGPAPAEPFGAERW